MLLKDKVAVITGGAGLNGLGFATARLITTASTQATGGMVIGHPSHAGWRAPR